MLGYALAPVLVLIAVLSRPGSIPKHLITQRKLTRIRSLILQRSIACLMLVPVLAVQVVYYPTWIVFTAASLSAILAIGVVVPVVAYLLTRSGSHSRRRSVFSELHGGLLFWTRYLLVTGTYMIAYEFLLRGIFLPYLAERMPVLTAVVINVLVYAAMHLVKDLKEALLCIPLGIFLCWLTLYTESVWPAAFFHLIMALSFEIFTSRRNLS